MSIPSIHEILHFQHLDLGWSTYLEARILLTIIILYRFWWWGPKNVSILPFLEGDVIMPRVFRCYTLTIIPISSAYFSAWITDSPTIIFLYSEISWVLKYSSCGRWINLWRHLRFNWVLIFFLWLKIQFANNILSRGLHWV